MTQYSNNGKKKPWVKIMALVLAISVGFTFIMSMIALIIAGI